jgi:hypothetical protein
VPIVKQKLVILIVGQGSRKCCGVHSEVGFSVTLKCTRRRDPISSATSRYKDTEACGYRNEEIASDDLFRVIPEKSGPALILRSPRTRRSCDVFPPVRGERRIWSLSQSSSAMRSSPQVGFSPAIRLMNRLISADIGSLPSGRDFQRQNRRKAARCQPINVAGFTITKALRHSNKRARRDEPAVEANRDVARNDYQRDS